ncbi:hypothetical protein BN7_4475 [Wickerhamomyces ciferrii]|uniref:Uncharacterized protein n=1 Tax=Wickerhamomyces ciferrii (strain ATCC 14091 / BCRC 22168 / CBS 111 / JCM 3599 / NBRC 0793 / NRRL Y-1031 F-60-10) TaxID=1206466 RepID=K0KPJ5_WICCF|nr:uncharacterized protein BN7_4475 [Wickerhamomyces ciferrii]CCH44906.1 hypothetical protein BN7_4475 [Wickerhamomyces ciferrii]
MIFDQQFSSESLPITPATSIAPPLQTPPNMNMSQSYFYHHDYNYHEDEGEDEYNKGLEPDDSPLLNSLQLSPTEQSYLDQLASAPQTPQLSGSKFSNSVPAYQFPSLKNHFTNNSNNNGYSKTQPPTRPETPNSELLSRENSIKLNHIPKSELSRDKTIRYSVHIENDDFELYKPIRRTHWFKGHGKSHSGFQQPNMGFLKNHKKSKSDY